MIGFGESGEERRIGNTGEFDFVIVGACLRSLATRGFLGPSAPHKKPSFGVASFRRLDLCFIEFRWDGAMGLFLVLFWCAAVARAFLRFNSRLGPNKFPFSRLRELAGKGLIHLAVFGAKTARFENNRENSRFH